MYQKYILKIYNAYNNQIQIKKILYMIYNKSFRRLSYIYFSRHFLFIIRMM